MIYAFSDGMTFEDFREDAKTVSAVERKLLMISEAVTRIAPQVLGLAPEIPWRSIKGLGNVLRHEYDRIDLEVIWRTITDDLPQLESATNRLLKQVSPEP